MPLEESFLEELESGLFCRDFQQKFALGLSSQICLVQWVIGLF